MIFLCSLKQWKNIKRHLKVVCEKFKKYVELIVLSPKKIEVEEESI